MDLIPVQLGDGLVVLHTREQYEQFMRGVDREAAILHDTPLEYIEQQEEQGEEKE